MNLRNLTFVGVVSLLLVFAGCAVVHVYVTFPEEKIEQAAEDLLAPPENLNSQGSMMLPRFTRHAYAQEVTVGSRIRTDSPVISRARERMNSWRKRLDEFKVEGFLGEAGDFRIVVRNIPRDRTLASEVRQVASNENRERENMLKELLRINNVAPGEEEKFRKVFGEVAQRFSPEGTWIQVDEEWIIKEAEEEEKEVNEE